MKVGTKKVAKLARRMGIRTPVSTNLAMALGGLQPGRHAAGHGARLRDVRDRRQADLRHAVARARATRRLPVPGPVGIERIDQRDGKKSAAPSSSTTASKHGQQAQEAHGAHARGRRRRSRSILQTVVKNGTATRAQIPGVMVAGKTGTTEDYGDAWFVGWTKEYTVAVWVGYPDEFKPMKTEFQGEPVAGGTFPAAIWKTFMQALLKIDPLPKKDGGDGTGKPDRRRPAPARRGRRATVAAARRTAAPPTARRPAATGGRRRRRRGRRRPPRPAQTAADDRPAARRTDPPAAADAAAAPTPARRTDAGRHAADADGAGEAAHAAATARYAASAASGPAARGARRPASRARRSATGSSAALVIPIRGPVTYGEPLAGDDRDRAVDQRRVVLGQLDPERLGQLARAVAQLARAAARAHLRRGPSSGSSARISTAAPTPSGSQTAFSSAWMP